ncbi:hypothetical protein M8J76_013381 [Diaphorina citri]|nr:hypothetical protein M8J76_013381 [Diaphorina citri]
MPTSGPVYQPTTVSYEQQNEWSSQPRSYLAQTVNRVNNPRCVQWTLLALGFVSIAIGLILFVEATIFTDNNKSAIPSEPTDASLSSSSIVLAVAGIILIIIGVLLVLAYVRIVQRRKGWPCFNNKSQRLTRDIDNQTNNGQILTLNPSTDLLVTSSQYNTVNEAPPTLSEEEETRKLMGNDIKESRHLTSRGDTVPSMALSPHRDDTPLFPPRLNPTNHKPALSPLPNPNEKALSPLPNPTNEKPALSPRHLYEQRHHPRTTDPNRKISDPSHPFVPLDAEVSHPPLSARLLKALRAPLASVEELTSSLESSAWSVTSRRDSVTRSVLLENENVQAISASRFSV